MTPEAPPRVVYLDHTAQLSGGELALLRLLPALTGAVDAYVILGEHGPLVTKLVDAGVEVEVLPMGDGARALRKSEVHPRRIPLGALSGALGYVGRLAARLRRLHPHLVHTNSLKAAVYGGFAGRAVGVPVLWQLRDRIAPDYLPGFAVTMVRGLARLVPTSIVGYEATLESLGSAGGHRFPMVDPVDPCCFDLPPAADRSGPLRVGMVGRIDPWKGQHVFIEAFARAFPSSNARAVIVGAPMFGNATYEAELHALAAARGIDDRVDFLGFRDDVPAEMATLDVAVHASVIDEPFGQVVTEAMAAALPVVASRGGGPASMITDGVDGLLTPRGDAAALAAALRRLADDPQLRRRLGSAARDRASAYSSERVAVAMLDAYRATLDGGPRRRAELVARRPV